MSGNSGMSEAVSSMEPCLFDSLNKFNDCKQCVQQFFNYEADILRGLIVQVYYELSEENMSKYREIDSKLVQLAFEFQGSQTKEEGLVVSERRRDMDFRFPDSKMAAQFRSCLSKFGFAAHSPPQVNRNGKLEHLDPSKLEQYQAQLIQNNC